MQHTRLCDVFHDTCFEEHGLWISLNVKKEPYSSEVLCIMSANHSEQRLYVMFQHLTKKTEVTQTTIWLEPKQQKILYIPVQRFLFLTWKLLS